MNRRSFFKLAGGAALTAVAAPLFIPAERLAFGVPRQALAVPEPSHVMTLVEYATHYQSEYAESQLVKLFSQVSPVLEELPFAMAPGVYDNYWPLPDEVQREIVDKTLRESVVAQLMRSSADLRGPRDYYEQSGLLSRSVRAGVNKALSDEGAYAVAYGPELIHAIRVPCERAD